MSLASVLIGVKITVYSRQGDTERQDVGLLEAVDSEWIRIKKNDGETLFFCLTNVRMLKPFEHVPS
ncbi:MAG: hypothetical protein P4L46_15330 [Fimbriimonas sp.]|nr:hypothetical protein [Fimbriimonas sp.]